jgi:outer membrane protein
MRNKIFLISVLAFYELFSLPARCQTDTLQFEDIMAEALENNFGIKIARNNASIAGNNNTPGNAGFLPVLNLSVTGSKSSNDTHQEYFDGRTRDANGAGSTNINAFTELDWTIFDGMRMFAARDRLAELEQNGQLELRMNLETLYVGLASLYYQLSQQQKLRQVLYSSISISKARLVLAQKKFQVGAASELDLNQAKIDFSSDSSLLIDQTVIIKNLMADINALAGRSPEIYFAAGHNFDLNYTIQYEPLKEKLHEQNIDVLMARSQMEIFYQQIKESRSYLFPNLSLYGSYNYLKSKSDVGLLTSNQSNGYGYGFRLNYNLFNGLNARRELDNARLDYNSSELNTQQVLIRSEANLLKSFNGYESALQEISLERENLQNTRKNLTIAIEKYRLGAINEIDFRNIQQNALLAESQLLTAEYLAKIAEISMLQLSGNLSLD